MFFFNLRPGVSACSEWLPSSYRYWWPFPVLELLMVVCSPLGGILYFLPHFKKNRYFKTNNVFNHLEIIVFVISLWLLGSLLVNISNDKNNIMEIQIVCAIIECFWNMQINILVCTVNVWYLNTMIMSLYSKCLVFEHHCCRLCFAAAREGHFPKVFSYISLNRRTPLPSIILTVGL